MLQKLQISSSVMGLLARVQASPLLYLVEPDSGHIEHKDVAKINRRIVTWQFSVLQTTHLVKQSIREFCISSVILLFFSGRLGLLFMCTQTDQCWLLMVEQKWGKDYTQKWCRWANIFLVNQITSSSGAVYTHRQKGVFFQFEQLIYFLFFVFLIFFRR